MLGDNTLAVSYPIWGKWRTEKKNILGHLWHMICSSKHLEHLLLSFHSLKRLYFRIKSVTICTNFILCLKWMIIKVIIPFFYTTYQLHWNHIAFGFSLQLCFKGCKGNIKVTSKPSAHRHFISFAPISTHIGKLSSCLSVYMDIYNFKQTRMHDFLSDAKKLLCTSPD